MRHGQVNIRVLTAMQDALNRLPPGAGVEVLHVVTSARPDAVVTTVIVTGDVIEYQGRLASSLAGEFGVEIISSMVDLSFTAPPWDIPVRVTILPRDP
jgi:hypothetical protein